MSKKVHFTGVATSSLLCGFFFAQTSGPTHLQILPKDDSKFWALNIQLEWASIIDTEDRFEFGNLNFEFVRRFDPNPLFIFV